MVKSALATNPLRKLRLSSNLTVIELANKVSVSTRTIYLAECGVYETPLEAVSHFFINGNKATAQEINIAYDQFRADARTKLKNRINPDMWKFSIPFNQITSFRTTLNTPLAPIKDFRINSMMLTQTAFIREFLVNPGTLMRLEDKKTYKNLPTEIKSALIECGAPTKFIEELNVRTKIYHDR